jgi:hypothetical protein
MRRTGGIQYYKPGLVLVFELDSAVRRIGFRRNDRNWPKFAADERFTSVRIGGNRPCAYFSNQP